MTSSNILSGYDFRVIPFSVIHRNYSFSVYLALFHNVGGFGWVL